MMLYTRFLLSLRNVEELLNLRGIDVSHETVRYWRNSFRKHFDLRPERLIAHMVYRSGPLLGWLVDEKIAPYILVIDKASRTDGTWSRVDFKWDAAVALTGRAAV